MAIKHFSRRKWLRAAGLTLLLALSVPIHLQDTNAFEGRHSPKPSFSPKTSVPGEIRLLTDTDYFDTVRALISGAKFRVDIAMFLFKTTGSKRDRPSLILEDLIDAAKRNVRVRVYLEESGWDVKLSRTNNATAAKLRENGIEVIFDTPSSTAHAKIVVIDSRYAVIGSHNLTHSALTRNRELSVLVDDMVLARETINYMESLSRSR